MLKRLLPLTIAIISISPVMPAFADLILSGRCQMGTCWEQKFFGKTLLEKGSDGTLYSVELATRSWPMGSEPSGSFSPSKISYVYCSTIRPTYIFKLENKYYAHFLNPGGDWFGYNRSEYPVYWATCHNFIGPDFFSENMKHKAIDLGYPLNLPSEQKELNNVRDILTQNATGQSQQLTRCVRWSTFSQGLTKTSGGRGGIWLAFNELPDGFKQGCIFFQDNNSLDVAYVLKDGIKPIATLTNGRFYDSYGGVPSFGSDGRGGVSSFRAEQSEQSLTDLMRRGQALMITWLTPTNGSIPYLNSIPKDRAFVRDDGMVCFSKVCMKSSAVSNQELIRILEAGQK
jgi:hypothetical protein